MTQATCPPVLTQFNSSDSVRPSPYLPRPWVLPTGEKNSTWVYYTASRSKRNQARFERSPTNRGNLFTTGSFLSSASSNCAKGTKTRLQMLTRYNTESPRRAGTTEPTWGTCSPPAEHPLLGGQHPSSGPGVFLLTTGIRNPPGIPVSIHSAPPTKQVRPTVPTMLPQSQYPKASRTADVPWHRGKGGPLRRPSL